MDKKIESPETDMTSENLLNEIDSHKKAMQGEREIKKFDEIFSDHKPQEDTEEISSTDDV